MGVLLRIPDESAVGSSLRISESSDQEFVCTLFEVNELSVISIFEQDIRSKEQIEIIDGNIVCFFIIFTNIQAGCLHFILSDFICVHMVNV